MQFWQSRDGLADNDPNYTECYFRFAGQYEDRETGLYYNRFRYYDKDNGQYITPDPIGLLGGLNPYGYVHCPTGCVDPFGLMECPPNTSSNDIPRGNNPYQTRVNPKIPNRPDLEYSIDTSTFTKGKATANGGIRNNQEFWQQWKDLQPDSLSKSNSYRINELGLSPKINDQWIKMFPEHANYKGDTIFTTMLILVDTQFLYQALPILVVAVYGIQNKEDSLCC